MHQITFYSEDIDTLTLLGRIAVKMGISVPFPVSESSETTETPPSSGYLTISEDKWTKLSVVKMAEELIIDTSYYDAWMKLANEHIKNKNLIQLIRIVRQSNRLGLGLVESKRYVENLLH